MAQTDKERFGARLCGLLEAVGVDEKDFAKALRISNVQIANYFKGIQTPTFDGLADLRNLFGIRSGELDGSEDFPLTMDREAARKRIQDLLNELT